MTHCLNRWTTAMALTACVVLPRAVRAQHLGDMLIASTGDGDGALTLLYDFAKPVVVSESFSGGGVALYSATDPGFDAVINSQPGDYALINNVQVRFEITAIDAGVSMQVNGTNIDTAGESALLGTSPNLHTHPIWRLSLASGVTGAYHVSFRLTASRRYDPSVTYTALVTNEPVLAASPTPSATLPLDTATPTTSPTESPSFTATAPATATPPSEATATASPSATAPPDATATTMAVVTATPAAGCAGDCNGDRRVTINELITGVTIALGSDAAACPDIDANADQAVTIDELVRAVSAALNGCAAA